ncbi:MAG: autotransporter domain-containing protein [Chthoniobacter sp.]|uniref:autotransporter outer membrane beta-barrel domain-containing protein n=1 Tax=Chthoniobacter sp. TaxID=2510640 RepID=UPI0032A6E900
MNNSALLFSRDRAMRPKLMVLAAGVGLMLGAFSGESRAEHPNLVVNGGFETGSFQGWTVIPAESFSDFGVGSLFQLNQVGLGATNYGSPIDSAPFGVMPNSGNFAAYYGAIFNQFDAISQRIHTFSGRLGVYRISFQLRSAGPPPNFVPSRFRAIWNGQVIYDTTNTVAGPYQQLVFKESAKGSKSTLTFEGLQSPGWYFLDDVSVQLVGKFANVENLTPNQHAVARALDRAANDHRASAVFGFLDYQETGDLPRAFDRIAPEELTSMFAMSTAYAQVQSLNLQRRTDDIRSNASGFSAANLAINGQGPSYSGGLGITTGVAGPTGNSGKESKEVKEVAPRETRWGTFLSGTGEWVNVSGTDNARGYNLSSGGFTLGVDYKVCPNFAIGLAAGYTGTTADLTDHGRIFTNGGKLGLYATTFIGGWYADVAAFGGYNSYDTRRSALEGDARGNTHGGEVDGLFGTGYDFKKGGLTFGPTASFNYTYAGTNAFTEHGSLVPLSIHGGKAESLRTALGFKASYEWKVGGMVIKPELRAAWQHEFGDAAYALDASFANGAGGPFTVNGPELGRDSALLGAGFAIQCTPRCSTYFYYDGEIGRTNYLSTSVTGGLRLTF